MGPADAPPVVLLGALASSALMVTEIPYPKIGDGFRVFASAGAVLAAAITLPTVYFGGGASCSLGLAGCPALELPLFAAATGIMVAYIVGGPLYVRVGSRQEMVSVQ